MAERTEYASAVMTDLRKLIAQWRMQSEAHLMVAKALSTTEDGRRVQLALEAARSKCADELEAALTAAPLPAAGAVIQEAETFITAANSARACEYYEPDLNEDVRRGEDRLCASCHFPKADHIIRQLLAALHPAQETK